MIAWNFGQTSTKHMTKNAPRPNGRACRWSCCRAPRTPALCSPAPCTPPCTARHTAQTPYTPQCHTAQASHTPLEYKMRSHYMRFPLRRWQHLEHAPPCCLHRQCLRHKCHLQMFSYGDRVPALGKQRVHVCRRKDSLHCHYLSREGAWIFGWSNKELPLSTLDQPPLASAHQLNCCRCRQCIAIERSAACEVSSMRNLPVAVACICLLHRTNISDGAF
mmetsp:Transcript_23074/g.41994  ORF Transcript_23074/g.41994 Transcript_23074/m.41994 type:complete len:219 (-) Transcript_23074:558-1214(-)